MNLNKLPYYSNILLVSGNGRNVGKTTLSCSLIKHFRNQKVIGVKVAPHFHEFDPDIEDILYHSNDVIIIEEHRKNTGKDSSKMKEAGASRVFYIMVSDENLQEAFDKLMEIVGNDNPMIIESAALRNIIKPAVFLLLKHIDRLKPKQSIVHLIDYVDQEIIRSSNGVEFQPSNISFIDNVWELI